MGDLVIIGNTAGRGVALPAIIAGAGKRAKTRFLEFFTVNIRNPNTRAAYGRAAGEFLAWCEGQGMGGLNEVQPVHVAAYIEHLGRRMSAPSVKQHLACIRDAQAVLLLMCRLRSSAAATP
jgi:site-specific recombinase XerD